MSALHLHHKAFAPQSRGPLSGIRVLDLSRLVAGNMTTLQLADFGADVIKIETSAEGDSLRNWRELSGVPGDAGVEAWFKVYCRNKRSLCLNLREPRGKALLDRLIQSSQVLVENFKPGTLEAMGLAPARLLELNPQLIILRISGWGQTGPYSHLPGFGSLIEGFSGFAAKTGFADRPPVLPNMALADMLAGLYGSNAVLMALREIEVNGGQGQVIDLSLLEAMVSSMGADAASYQVSGKVPQRGSKLATPRNAYQCADGKWVAMSASTDAMAHRVFTLIGRADMVADPKFATHGGRLANDEEVDQIVGGFIARHSQAQALGVFRDGGVTVGPIYDIAQLVEDEHIREREVLVSLPDEQCGSLAMHEVCPRLSGSPGAIRHRAPLLGEHGSEILAELGVDAEEAAELRRAKIV